nr:MAG TPA: hypothetical protein [Caudoviricetes sp.]
MVLYRLKVVLSTIVSPYLSLTKNFSIFGGTLLNIR